MPSDTQRRFAVLAAMVDAQVVRQRPLAQRLGISLGSVNGIVRHLEADGMLAVNRAKPKRPVYHVTNRGRSEMTRLARQAAASAIGAIDAVRERLHRQVDGLACPRSTHVLICARGALADIAASAIAGAGLRLAGVVNAEDAPDVVAGKPVQPLDAARNVACGVAIAFTESDVRKLRARVARGVAVIHLLRVPRRPNGGRRG